MTIRASIFAGLLGTLFAASAADATVLYSNGAFNGLDSAILFSGSSAIADSFTLSGPSTVTGADIYTWTSPGGGLTSIGWSILSAEPGTAGVTTLFSGTASSTGNTEVMNLNIQGYDVYENTLSLGSNALVAGTYWLELTNAVNSVSADSLYWDINGGPSSAWDSHVGDITTGSICTFSLTGPGGRCSNSFDILGPAAVAAVPEPSDLWVLLTGLFAVLGSALAGAGLKGPRPCFFGLTRN